VTIPPVDDVVTHHRWTVNGLDVHLVEAGEGPLVVLLHGFPDFWYSWRRQIPELSAAGFRVLAPDLRGYADTEVPLGVAAYRLEHLVADVADLVTVAGERSAHLVGHDWGGIIAWTAAATHPERCDRLAVCNTPHPRAVRRAFRHPRQLVRSWYTYAFHVPVVPELALRARDSRLLRQVLRAGAMRDDSFSDADLDRYTEALLGRGDLTGPINYYLPVGRAPLRWPFARRRSVPHDRSLCSSRSSCSGANATTR
jgi:epoxide hydrolase 4